MTSTSPSTPPREQWAGPGTPLPIPPPGKAPASIAELQTRVQSQSAQTQQALLAMTNAAMQELADQFQSAARSHADALQRRTLDELRSTATAIEDELAIVRWTSQRASRASRRLLLLPPITAAAVSAVLLIMALVTSWHLTRGIPSQTSTTPNGDYQILTGTEWTTCPWQDRTAPCRPAK